MNQHIIYILQFIFSWKLAHSFWLVGWKWGAGVVAVFRLIFPARPLLPVLGFSIPLLLLPTGCLLPEFGTPDLCKCKLFLSLSSWSLLQPSDCPSEQP